MHRVPRRPQGDTPKCVRMAACMEHLAQESRDDSTEAGRPRNYRRHSHPIPEQKTGQGSEPGKVRSHRPRTLPVEQLRSPISQQTGASAHPRRHPSQRAGSTGRSRVGHRLRRVRLTRAALARFAANRTPPGLSPTSTRTTVASGSTSPSPTCSTELLTTPNLLRAARAP